MVQSEVPILAHRWARVNLHPPTNPFWAVSDAHGSFGVVADAECRRIELKMVMTGSSPYWSGSVRFGRSSANSRHRPPELRCSCGFYAVPLHRPSDFTSNANALDLLVELRGRVLECDFGFRAQRQRVLEVRLAPCPCGMDNDAVIMNALTGFVVEETHIECESSVSWYSYELIGQRRGEIPLGAVTRKRMSELLEVPVVGGGMDRWDADGE